jgi:hypothetical protein
LSIVILLTGLTVLPNDVTIKKMIDTENEQYYTREKAAYILGVSLRTLDRMRASGEIEGPPSKKGVPVRIPVESIQRKLGHVVNGFIERSSL